MTDICSSGQRFIAESDNNIDSENGDSSMVTDFES